MNWRNSVSSPQLTTTSISSTPSHRYARCTGTPLSRYPPAHRYTLHTGMYSEMNWRNVVSSPQLKTTGISSMPSHRYALCTGAPLSRYSRAYRYTLHTGVYSEVNWRNVVSSPQLSPTGISSTLLFTCVTAQVRLLSKIHS